MKHPQHDIQAFLYGYKPTYLHVTDYRFPFQTQEEIDQLEKYPHVGKIVSFRNRLNQIIYFQDENFKEVFLSSDIDLFEENAELQRLLGRSLGYPPKAVEYYINYVWKTEKNRP